MRHRIARLLAAGSAALTITGGMLALAGTAGAATSLTVTLSSSGSGASAVYDAAGDPVLTVGTPSSSTYAEITIDSPSTAAPSAAPTFTTSNYAAGSPHWLIQFGSGDELVGYPSSAGLGSSNWSVVPASSGSCDVSDPAGQHDSYIGALAFIQGAGCGGNVTGAAIIANGSQAAGTSDTITDVTYDGETLAVTPDVVTVTNPGTQTGTAGTAGTLDIAASSNDGDQITSYGAAGLPAGLTLDTTTGAITGTPSTAGTYSVTISAIDSGGTTGSAAFTWTIQAAAQAPVFTVDTPPATATAGQLYGYTFVASGTPAPVYALGSGSPGWMSIDTSTGTISGTVPAGVTSFSYSVTATNAAGTATAGPFTVTVTAAAVKADLAARLSCPASLKVTGTGSCTLTVTNRGPAAASKVIAAVALPASLAETGCSSGCTRHANVYSWTAPTLADGASATYTVTVKAVAAGRALVLGAAGSASPDPDPLNNIALAPVTITK
jgi:putative Ig domain-containing protein/uncharacterized protein DUF11